MNCKQVENLLPLYVSRDLNETRERSVTAHLQDCVNCIGAAEEYRQTRELLQGFAPAAFSERVYADIRQNVWREIEAQAAAPSMVDLIAGWFTPRFTWAVAVSLLIVVSVFGLYSIAGQNPLRQEAVLNCPVISRNVSKQQKSATGRESSTTSSLASSEGVNKPRQVYIRHFDRRGDRRRAPDRLNSLVAHAPDAASLPNDGSAAQPNAVSNSQSGKTLRMELQTKDPNIRIIWFVPQDTKPVSRGLKGT